jgi:hypothetical protein
VIPRGPEAPAPRAHSIGVIEDCGQRSVSAARAYSDCRGRRAPSGATHGSPYADGGDEGRDERGDRSDLVGRPVHTEHQNHVDHRLGESGLARLSDFVIRHSAERRAGSWISLRERMILLYRFYGNKTRPRSPS